MMQYKSLNASIQITTMPIIAVEVVYHGDVLILL